MAKGSALPMVSPTKKKVNLKSVNTKDDEEVTTICSSFYKMRSEVISVCFHANLGTLTVQTPRDF